MIQTQDIVRLLGGPRTVGRRVTTSVELEQAVSAGLKREALDHLLAFVAPESERAQLRNRIVPRASYQRRARLNPAYSATTERLARIVALARWVWEDDEKARMFLRAPHPELGGRTPLEAALTELGARQVEEIVDRGIHGLPV
jgi:putative toxin-antitoxin system antitoxin component (TIGR02293 family)